MFTILANNPLPLENKFSPLEFTQASVPVARPVTVGHVKVPDISALPLISKLVPSISPAPCILPEK